jgi:type IV pilus assembly protein PilX
MNGLTSNRQQGAALVVGLVLLVVLTILAVSGVFTSTMELRMVRNSQSQERAFQAAEVAIENALANPTITTNKAAPEIQAPTANPNALDDQYSYTLAFRCSSIPPVSTDPDDVFSIGEFSAYHFQVDANGTGPDNAVAQHTQGFYVIAGVDPEPENDCT